MAARVAHSFLHVTTTFSFHSTCSLETMTSFCLAMTRAVMATVRVASVTPYLVTMSTRAESAFTARLPVLMPSLATGSNFSPSSTLTSRNPLAALSMPACTVLFCTLNSLITLVPSS